MQCKHDENMMMPCQRHSNVKQTMMMWCSWNANTNDVMPPDSYGGSNEMEPPMTLWCYGLHLAPKQPVWIPVSPLCMYV